MEFSDAVSHCSLYMNEVISIEILDGNMKPDLCSGEWPLTLYTCTLSGMTRVTVRCDRVR